MPRIYQDISPMQRIDVVWMEYHRTKDRKRRSELREEYRRLAQLDQEQTGFKRYQKL